MKNFLVPSLSNFIPKYYLIRLPVIGIWDSGFWKTIISRLVLAGEITIMHWKRAKECSGVEQPLKARF